MQALSSKQAGTILDVQQTEKLSRSSAAGATASGVACPLVIVDFAHWPADMHVLQAWQESQQNCQGRSRWLIHMLQFR